METENALQAPHQLQLDSRSRLHMTGVIEVESFDEATIVLTTTRGTLIVRGENLHLQLLRLDGGEVLALSKALAQELGPSGIRVNAICPGVIQTDMCANVAPEVMESLREQTPIEKLGRPEDVAQAMAYLIDAPFVTGQVLGVNGGFVIT